MLTEYPRGTGMETAKISNLVLQHSQEIQALQDASTGGGGVSQAYVDASLGARDVEISANADDIAVLDASIVEINSKFSGGWTGTFTADGSTVSVTDGLITGVTP